MIVYLTQEMLDAIEVDVALDPLRFSQGFPVLHPGATREEREQYWRLILRKTVYCTPLVQAGILPASIVGDFSNYELKYASLQGVYFEDCSFNKADLYCADLQRTAGFVSFVEADLRYARLQGANYAEPCFNLARLNHVSAHGASFMGGNFASTNLSFADLTAANLFEIEGHSANFRYLQGCLADFYGASLVEANFEHANLKLARFVQANLEQANFTKACLREASFKNAILRDASFRGANLEGAYLEGADLENAVYDHRTVWPKGFDPEAAGAILVVE